MGLKDLTPHDQELVQIALRHLTRETVPECDCCGFAHGTLETLGMVALEDTKMDFAVAEKLFREEFQKAISFQKSQKTPSIRTVDDEASSDENFQDAAGYCELCEKGHPFVDMLAIAVICGLKTEQEVETAFAAGLAYLQSLSNVEKPK